LVFPKFGTETFTQEERLKNVRAVNEGQLKSLSGNFTDLTYYNPEKRYFDIYARYGHGRMDPFQLAIITQTIKWYIEGGHSKLFTDVRLVSDRPTSLRTKEHRKRNTAWIVKSIYNKTKVIYPEGKDFVNSMIGANRFYLTQSTAQDSAKVNSAPMGTIPVHGFPNKRPEKDFPIVEFNADFDKEDSTRLDYRNYNYISGGVEGNIQKLIEETILKMRELEEMEIARFSK
jgi:hypothetical protein